MCCGVLYCVIWKSKYPYIWNSKCPPARMFVADDGIEADGLVCVCVCCVVLYGGENIRIYGIVNTHRLVCSWPVPMGWFVCVLRCGVLHGTVKNIHHVWNANAHIASRARSRRWDRSRWAAVFAVLCCAAL
jgi:hypothetical protein